MLKPRDVFEDPTSHWAFLTASRDEDCEGQYFDRKEVGDFTATADVLRKQVRGVIGHITECISAFANRNLHGGLLVLGIAKNGSVRGINHLNDAQRNSLANINVLLKNHATEVRLCSCTDYN